MITRYFNLQLNAGGALPPVINVNQYDQGEQWVFTLYQDDGTVYTPSSGSIVGVKADGNAIANAGSIDADGRVVITETQQMTAVAGVVNCELTLDSGVHGTLNFTLQVEADPVDGAVVSASDLSLISQGIQAAEDARTALGSIAPTNVGTAGQFLKRNATTSEWADIGSDDVTFADSETLTTKMTAVENDISTLETEIDELLTTTTSTTALDISSTATAWSLTVTKAGYTPLVYNLYHGNSTDVIVGVESVTRASGTFTIAGFKKTINSSTTISATATLVVLWKKD